jgi:Na+/H+-dicarboxylate symporter
LLAVDDALFFDVPAAESEPPVFFAIIGTLLEAVVVLEVEALEVVLEEVFEVEFRVVGMVTRTHPGPVAAIVAESLRRSDTYRVRST